MYFTRVKLQLMTSHQSQKAGGLARGVQEVWKKRGVAGAAGARRWIHWLVRAALSAAVRASACELGMNRPGYLISCKVAGCCMV